MCIMFCIKMVNLVIFYLWFVVERFHSRGRHLCKFIGTNESIYIRRRFISHRIVFEHGHHFIVLEHQYGRCDVMWKRPIASSIARWEFFSTARALIGYFEVTLHPTMKLFPAKISEQAPLKNLQLRANVPNIHGLKVWPISNFARQLPTTGNNMATGCANGRNM